MTMYPDNWNELSWKCKELVGWKCEDCGTEENLTAAHIHHDIDNPDPELKCLCWPCHLLYDASQSGHPEKTKRRKETIQKKRKKKDKQEKYKGVPVYHGSEKSYARRV